MANTGFRIVTFGATDIAGPVFGRKHGLLRYPVSEGTPFAMVNPDTRFRLPDSLREYLCYVPVVNMWIENFDVLVLEGMKEIRALVFGECPNWLTFIEDPSIKPGYTTDFLINRSINKHASATIVSIHEYCRLPIRTVNS